MSDIDIIDINDGGYAGEIDTDIITLNESSIKLEDMRPALSPLSDVRTSANQRCLTTAQRR